MLTDLCFHVVIPRIECGTLINSFHPTLQTDSTKEITCSSQSLAQEPCESWFAWASSSFAFQPSRFTNTIDNAARALRRVAENSTFKQQEKSRAFVLMQYFGYLRRNPNDPQDTDYTGYDFWLTKLNEFNGNFINAEMVKAFIDSREYRERFGP